MRIIYRLDVKTKNVVKPISFEGLRKVGNPVECAEKAYKEGADEILFLDIVASLYDRKFNYEIIKDTVKDVFLPITVGGGIKNIDDATNLIYAGADKLAINTSLFDRLSLSKDIADIFGSQAIVASVQTRKVNDDYVVMKNNGRDFSSYYLDKWLEELVNNKVGEILVTSIDHDGTLLGVDQNLVKRLKKYTKYIPIVYSGGYKSVIDMEILSDNEIEAVAIGCGFHYGNLTVSDVREHAKKLCLPLERQG